MGKLLPILFYFFLFRFASYFKLHQMEVFSCHIDVCDLCDLLWYLLLVLNFLRGFRFVEKREHFQILKSCILGDESKGNEKVNFNYIFWLLIFFNKAVHVYLIYNFLFSLDGKFVFLLIFYFCFYFILLFIK